VTKPSAALSMASDDIVSPLVTGTASSSPKLLALLACDSRSRGHDSWVPLREAYCRRDAKEGARDEWRNGGISEKKESPRMISESGGTNPFSAKKTCHVPEMVAGTVPFPRR